MDNANDCEDKKLKDYFWIDKEGNPPPYYVEDIQNCNPSKVDYILLCESPHKDEVNHLDKEGHSHPIPLVGKTGVGVSSFLFHETIPIGELIDNKCKTMPNMAIVNVSNVPLQIIVGCNENAKELGIESIRENEKVKDFLLNDLKNRLSKYSNTEKTIIVCGGFADAYFSKIQKDINYHEIITVPHPSRNQWSFVEKHLDDIRRLRKLSEIINNSTSLSE